MQTSKAKLFGLALLVPLAALAAPWVLPTLDGEAGIVTPGPAKPKPAPIDARAVWEAAQACWPSRSFFKVDVRAEARGGSRYTTSALDGTLSSTDRVSGAIVVSMPLYSGIELERERDREYKRRVDAAKIVGELVETTTKVHTLERELDLLRAIERRAQERVKHGVAETMEQLAALKAVAETEGKLTEQQAKTIAAKLAVEATCEVGKAHLVREAIKGAP